MARNVREKAVAMDMKASQERLKRAMTLNARLASKLASVVVHAEEMLSPMGHQLDKKALEQACRDPEVQEWVNSLGPLAPRKRW